MKTSTIIEVYQLLNTAKLTKMESKEKFSVIKIMRAMKPVAEEWDSFVKTMDEKLKGENHEEMLSKAQQWQKEGEKTTLSLDERMAVNEYFAKFNKDRTEMITSEQSKEVNILFDKLTEEAFERLVDSNDFNVGQIVALQEAIC